MVKQFVESLEERKNLSIRQRIYGYKSYIRCKELFDVEKRGSKKNSCSG